MGVPGVGRGDHARGQGQAGPASRHRRSAGSVGVAPSAPAPVSDRRSPIAQRILLRQRSTTLDRAPPEATAAPVVPGPRGPRSRLWSSASSCDQSSGSPALGESRNRAGSGAWPNVGGVGRPALAPARVDLLGHLAVLAGQPDEAPRSAARPGTRRSRRRRSRASVPRRTDARRGPRCRAASPIAVVVTRRWASGSQACESAPCWLTITSGPNAAASSGTSRRDRLEPGRLAGLGLHRDVDDRAGRGPLPDLVEEAAPREQVPPGLVERDRHHAAGRPRTGPGRRRRGGRRSRGRGRGGPSRRARAIASAGSS